MIRSRRCWRADEPFWLQHWSQVGRFLHASPRAVQGWTQLIGTFGFEIAEVRQIDLKGKTVCPSPDWCSKQNYMPLWHWARKKKIPDINEHQICHTNEQDFCCLVRRGSNHDLFFRQNPNFNNEGGEKCHVKCSALGKQLGKKKSEPLGFSSFYFIFFLLVLFLIRVTQVSCLLQSGWVSAFRTWAVLQPHVLKNNSIALVLHCNFCKLFKSRVKICASRKGPGTFY